MLDSTKEWFAVVRRLRQEQQQNRHQSGVIVRSADAVAGRGGGYSSAAEALVGLRWRTPLSPFMQQATELNNSIREMHAFLRHNFLDYVDVHHCLPSKRSIMTEEEKDLIDLEVTSFMTACAAGVDALKALLQRERLRRMEQEAAAARGAAEGGGGDGGDAKGGPSLLLFDDGGGGGALRPGSRPAHENAAVTFLFERLKAVTEVAETMQTERHAKSAASKARFYGGPADSGKGFAAASAAAAKAAGDNDGDTNDENRGSLSTTTASAESLWKPTPEEVEEERFLQASLPAAYGSSSTCRPPSDIFIEDDVADGVAAGGGDGGGGDRGGGITETSPSSDPPPSSPLPAAPSLAAGAAVTGAGTVQQRRPAAATAAEERRREEPKEGKEGKEKRPGVLAGTAGAVRRRLTGQGQGQGGSVRKGEGGGGGGGASGPGAVTTAMLEGENRDLVARLKNELDDARLVETKMSEISGLMGLFASKVVEQQGGMEHVFDAAVSVNDKVARGGQHLEKAAQRGGTFRMFYAWFMMGASFCLLFLHFYNP
ncbi:unnamed protein product [Pylaiella littoralis]